VSKVLRVVDPANWIWQGRFTCRHCCSEFTPEQGDPGLKIRDDEFDVFCPVCNSDNRFRRGPMIAPHPDQPATQEIHISVLPGI
jgi:transposase-like protein